MKAQNFCLPDADGKEYCLKQFRGKWVILYFYPKDNTSGCTKEAVGFTEMKDEFKKLNAVIIGVSKDSPASHRKFIDKHDLDILLLSDEEHKVLEKYGAWGLKKNYGREYYGTKRTTILIDPEGSIKKEWHNVRVKGHVESVLDTLKSEMVEK